MMQHHCTRETRKAANLVSSRAARILTWSHHASLTVSKCIHLNNGQRPHRGYSQIISPQLSNATVIVHRPITNGSKRHDGCLTKSSSGSPICQRRGCHYSGPCRFSSNFQTQITTSSVPRDLSSACQGRLSPRPRSRFNPNLELARTHQAANKITDDSSHPRHPQCAITTEGGHTQDTTSITSEGVHWLPDTLTP
jgi:hypothetical protein